MAPAADALEPRSSDDLARFRRAQRIAFDAVLEIARGLEPGASELEVAARLEAALGARGVRRWFHAPFVWFGARSRLDGIDTRRRFFPTGARLAAGAVAILDVGPIVDGCPGDVAYAVQAPGAAPAERLAFARAREALGAVRELIPIRIAAGDTMRAIYLAVDRALAARGYEGRHARYPFGVLGHQVRRFGERPDPRIAGFGVHAIWQLVGGGLASRVPGVRARSPLWTADADRAVAPGVWSMEPHLGADGFGAKFEEMLVVPPDRRAYWLDDDAPLGRAA